MAVLFDDPDVLFDDPNVTFDGIDLTPPPEPPAPFPPYGLTPVRPIPGYELGLWQRTPAASGTPTYVEVGQVVSPTITWSDELDGDGTINASCQPDRLDADVKQALRNCFTPDGPPQGLELRLIRKADGAASTVWAGPLVGIQIQGGTLSLAGHGLGYYLRYMWITSDLEHSGVDQYTIGKGLVDHWQALSYGHFGIDTSGIGTSGTTRDRTYLAAEHPNVHKELAALSDVQGGFDWWIDPETRALMFGDRGSDLSGSVVLDSRNIADAGIAADVAAGEFASEAFGIGTSGTDAPITSTQSDTAVREAFGRTGVAGSFDGVSVQGTLDDHTAKLVDDRNRPSFIPGPQLIPVKDADVGDFGPGDTVGFEYDAGLGLQTFTRRIVKLQTTVGPDGSESLAAEFA